MERKRCVRNTGQVRKNDSAGGVHGSSYIFRKSLEVLTKKQGAQELERNEMRDGGRREWAEGRAGGSRGFPT